MGKSSYSAIDIVGISIGVLVVLLTVGSLVVISRSGLVFSGWRDMAAWAPWSGYAESGGSGSAEGAESEQTVEGAFTVLDASGVAGEIVIGSHDGTGVKVRSVKRAPTQRALDALQTEIVREGSRLVVREKRELPYGNSGSISFYITIPKGTAELRARTVSGRIRVQGLPAGVRQSLESVSGRIETDGSGDLDAGTVSGDIDFVFAGRELKAKTISGGVRGTIESLSANGRAEAGSVSGSVRLAAREGFAARVSLHSLSGSVSCDFPLAGSMQKRNTLEGTIGGGGASLDVGTTSGSIRIERK